MLQLGLRAGDTLVLLAKGDLGRGGELAMIRSSLKESGIAVEVAEHEAPPAKQRGRAPAFSPNEDQDKTLKKLWHDVSYPGPYVQRRGCEMADWGDSGENRTKMRNFLNNRYGPRVKRRDMN